MTDSLVINEIFHSIQGESTWAGLPCTLIRLTGCHLRCTYCDTAYAFYEGNRMTLDEIVADVQRLSASSSLKPQAPRLAEITGGEPLLQPNVHPLMARLCDEGYTVLIETSGACDISACDPRVIRIMDLKTPGSGEADRNDWANLQHLTERDEVKFVLTSRGDYDWAKRVMEEHDLAGRVKAVLMSAAAPSPSPFEGEGRGEGHKTEDPHALPQSRKRDKAGVSPSPNPSLEGRGAELSLRDLAGWILADGLPVRLQTQLHKLIWDPNARGV